MALQLVRTAGELRFEKGVELILFRYDIYDSRPSEVLNSLRYALNYHDRPAEISDALKIAKAIAGMEDLVPAKIDVGISFFCVCIASNRIATVQPFAEIPVSTPFGTKRAIFV